MGQVIFKRMWAWLMHTRLYIRALGKWISLAVVTLPAVWWVLRSTSA